MQNLQRLKLVASRFLLSTWQTLPATNRHKFRCPTCLLLFLLLMLMAENRVLTQKVINRAPYFVSGTGDMSRFSISENTTVNSPVYQLKGVDPDGSRLKYSISGPVFSVDRDTGVVRLRQTLDRETQDSIEVIISITDEAIGGTEPNTISLRRVIPVLDYNDNPPVFVGRPYTATIGETAKVGAELTVTPPIIITDRDAGINAEIYVKCVKESDICDTFDVRTEQISDGNYTARIFLKKILDYETRPTYVMTISAKDGALENSLASLATVSINVQDEQDEPPKFLNAPYSATLEENTAPDTLVLTINAVDGDVANTSTIYLAMEDEKFGYFQLKNIVPGRAEIRTTKIGIDRENPDILQNGGVYMFAVRATEFEDGILIAAATTQVTIIITDIDDNVPRFNKDFFNVTIPENLESSMPLPGLSIYVEDLDDEAHAKYNLSLRNVHNSEGVFAITPMHGVSRTPIVVKVHKPAALDYDVKDVEKRKFIFEIVATVGGVEKASTRVEVHLKDVNDNAPVFNTTILRREVPENATVGTKIGKVHATDKDSGSFGDVNYILKGFGAEDFHLDAISGDISVEKKLDYELQSSYSLTVVAVDGGGLESNINLHIEVLDVNDNYPQFENEEYMRIIREGSNQFQPQFFVRATDKDGPMQGDGKIAYAKVSENSISGNVFHVDEQSGEITFHEGKFAKSMDTERGEYELVVKATDFGTPPLSSTVRILIRVGISTNQRPIFKGHFQNLDNLPVVGPPSYRVSIPENAPSGYNVTKVSAHDPDGLDELLRYQIIGANDNFQIDEKTGMITVSPHANIDRDKGMDSFEITVSVVDAGIPLQESATTTVYVNIKDINDEKPRFLNSSYVAYVSERANIGKKVLTVQANDPDLNSKLVYSIKGPIEAVTKAGVSANRSNYNARETFTIDSQTGDIVVNSTLNHDAAAVISFKVEVRDMNAEVDPEGQTDTAEVTIYVQSFKEINPVFLNDGWTSTTALLNVTIVEEMPIGSVLFILQAEDPVAETPITKFELLDEAPKYVEVHSRSGEVILKERLDYEQLERPYFEFKVKASVDDHSRETITKVRVNVENVNDNSPMFEEELYHTTVVENKKHPERIIQVKATDKDKSLTQRDERLGFHKIVYSLHGEYAPLFHINSTTGLIIIAENQTIDHERTPHIKLTVKSEDSPGQPIDSKQSTVELTIDVLDVNDNVPEFVEQHYTAVVPENVPIGTPVLKVLATDPDEGPGGEVRYEILNEGELNGLLSIHTESGDITTKRELTGKGRSKPYTLIIQARDNGDELPKQESLSSVTEVELYIGDVFGNDGAPYFIEPKTDEEAMLLENAPIGTVVCHIQAEDPDDPKTPAGTLFYQILEDSPDAEAFAIDADTGVITSTMSLDRETKDLYNIIVEVSDNGNPRQSASRVLRVLVLDEDDHEPLFAREIDEGPLVFSVLEEEPEGTFVGQFNAIDDDIEENAEIDYLIINGNNGSAFKIERTPDNRALLKTARAIDREQEESFELVIKCVKFGATSYELLDDEYDRNDLSMLKVVVKIVDIDDNLPEFVDKDASIGIRITVPIDTVIANVRAIDRDIDALPIILTLDNVTFVPQFYKRKRPIDTTQVNKMFTLHNQTGQLRTGGSFADFVDGYFQLSIRANNSENVKRHTFNNVKVFVIRDKSLLKFVFSKPPVEVQPSIQTFQQLLMQKLQPLGYDLHILDTQVHTRPDATFDFSATSSCFQMFHNGTAMPFQDMKNLMESDVIKRELISAYVEFGVSDVESCSARPEAQQASFVSAPGPWLVLLAAFIGVATSVATITACCMQRRYRRITRDQFANFRNQSEPYSIGAPIYYAEPVYSNFSSF